MTWLLVILALFVGGTIGGVMMAVAAAAKDADDFWVGYERGFRDGAAREAEPGTLP